MAEIKNTHIEASREEVLENCQAIVTGYHAGTLQESLLKNKERELKGSLLGKVAIAFWGDEAVERSAEAEASIWLHEAEKKIQELTG